MNFLQKLKSGANKATERAQNVMEINKLNTQISNIEKEMGIYYQRMGQVFYEGYRAKDMREAETEMMELAKTCDLLAEEQTELRGKIAALKNERLCECGKIVPEEALFCPYCGNKLKAKPASSVKKEQPEPQERRNPFISEDEGAATDETVIYSGPLIPDLDEDAEDQLLTPEEEERRQRELERERERQLELDRRIRTWKENVQSPESASVKYDYKPPGSERSTVNCQICAAQLAKGTKWCPHCGSEQI
ncbi:zinc ribbon domain-containing protein [Paenibacillus sp. CAA11]|uniref:zinc-ribbon domain-containing protein n=1 Tax=Paenibacillus sp. CAA11 TaxID=1532905 RepID=UPI000D3A4F28|nr:zinc-ribbon domain-containing protein [Paenibacillus sp. CAA11]AWB43261.1 zinc ribbon domain-containing protein [Paenibacillus sp. CAA11]